jgi:muconolactone delta-isomerase
MQFLVITKSAHPAPPEMALPLIEATQAWVAQLRASGKVESVWSIAGTIGGGGVFNVDSHEELDAIMAGFPFSAFSTIEVIALADMDKSLAGGKAAIEQMMAMSGPK